MTRDELRERVARAICQNMGPRCHCLDNPELVCSEYLFHATADAAIAVVLEEAAKVAEAFPAHDHGNLATAPPQAAEQAADEIAAAIRALISKKGIE